MTTAVPDFELLRAPDRHLVPLFSFTSPVAGWLALTFATKTRSNLAVPDGRPDADAVTVTWRTPGVTGSLPLMTASVPSASEAGSPVVANVGVTEPGCTLSCRLAVEPARKTCVPGSRTVTSPVAGPV